MFLKTLQRISITCAAFFNAYAFLSGRWFTRISISHGLITYTAFFLGLLGIITFFLSIARMAYEQKTNRLLPINLLVIAYPLFILGLFVTLLL